MRDRGKTLGSPRPLSHSPSLGLPSLVFVVLDGAVWKLGGGSWPITRFRMQSSQERTNAMFLTGCRLQALGSSRQDQ